MKKVGRPQQIRVKLGNTNVRSTKPMTYALPKAKGSMINKEALKGKTGGNNLSNYYLDLMKLT